MIKEITFSLLRKMPVPGFQYAMISPAISITYAFPETATPESIQKETAEVWGKLSGKLDHVVQAELHKAKVMLTAGGNTNG